MQHCKHSLSASILFGLALPAAADNWVTTTSGSIHSTHPTKVGVGVAAPQAALTVRRDARVNGEKNLLVLERNGVKDNTDAWMGFGYRADATRPTRLWLGSGINLPLDFRTSGRSSAMTILNNGNVGINNTNPPGPFDVRGGVAGAGLAGAPIVISGQQGYDNFRGGHLTLNSGPNGPGSQNGDLLLGTGGTINADGTFSVGERMRIYGPGVTTNFSTNVSIGLPASGNAPLAPNNSTPLYVRRNLGQNSGDYTWMALDRNGANGPVGNQDPVLILGYRSVNNIVSRTIFGPGNGFPIDFRTSASPNAMTILDNGNVGINQPSPASLLHLTAATPELTLTSTASDPWAAIRGNAATWLLGYGGPINSEEISIGSQDNHPSNRRTLSLSTGGKMRVKIDAAGKVGINTPSPEKALHVVGDAKITGSIEVASVVTRAWHMPTPDYVFEKGYKLASLDEVESFVKRNKHLPEVPSAKQLDKDGLDLAEMNLTLLKKVEELTLYAIEQRKQNQALARRVEQLERTRSGR